jgi:DNA-binding transcriptional ArsR family regulator
MTRRDSEILLRTLNNPTKLGVLVLLSDGDSMTVTQMSKLVKVSRANLYHFVSEMVADGVLAGPESRVKRNYVEKFYRLDQGFFDRAGEAELGRALKPETPEALRDILYSLLVSVSAQFRIMAEQLAAADAAAAKRLAEMRDEKAIVGAFMVLPDDEYLRFVKGLNQFLARFEGRKARKAPNEGKNKVALFAIPASVYGQADSVVPIRSPNSDL